MENLRVANIFNEIADLLEIKGDNPFRIRSYRNAGLVIEGLPVDIKTIAERDEKELEEIPGIGKGLHEKIVEILNTGSCAFHQDILREIPASLLELLKVQGIGPKKVKLFHEKLGIKSVADLEKAAKGGKLRGLPGMGEKSEEKIISGIESLKKYTGRYGLAVGMSWSDRLVKYLKEVPGVEDVVPAGSLRRGKETIGDLDILVTAKKVGPVMDRFVAFSDVTTVVAKGDTKTTVILKDGLQADVRVLEKRSLGAALQYFTGSKSHNVALRERARKMGLKISEYGVFREKDEKWMTGETEEGVYKAVGLQWIPPELRENRGEIEAAEEGKLPDLIRIEDIRGDLHVHTRESDGGHTIEELADYAIKKGYEYIAVTDHSKAVGIAHGLDEARLLKQVEEIDRFNEGLAARGRRFRVLKGSEVDIRADGSLDLDEKALKKLDIVVGAIHSRFNMTEEEMTQRLIKAMETGMVNIIAHPTGRLISGREPYPVDMEKLFTAARRNRVIFELNSYPDRLDLNDIHCRLAKEMGVMIAVSTDTHIMTQMDFMSFGINNARRGWIEKSDVLNTRSLRELLKILKR